MNSSYFCVLNNTIITKITIPHPTWQIAIANPVPLRKRDRTCLDYILW
ncbi:hypothetical protein [Roseofilum casamattae]|uniref:Uncharacterized protein n=1 Tax=Roseofilum casamattae BLCC-M143 TaxID=3022442 RepID=A0ABT7BUV1_9CYAN|nr:hypothetical protein [Roseofilum casamattae]MDJ1182967.1 hypothetical protein [Roseofilum casamattae BLCC-M143]